MVKMKKVRRVSVTRKSDDSDLGFIQHSLCSASSINSEHSIYLRWVPFLSLPVKKSIGGGEDGFFRTAEHVPCSAGAPWKALKCQIHPLFGRPSAQECVFWFSVRRFTEFLRRSDHYEEIGIVYDCCAGVRIGVCVF